MLGGKGRFYKKSLIMMFVVAGIPGLIMGVLVYWMAGGRVEEELLQLHYRQIEERSHNIDDQLSNLELMLAHWAFDPKFDYNLKDSNFVREYDKTVDITKTLLVMQGSNAMVRKAELVLFGARPILFNAEYSVMNEQTAKVYEPLVREKKPAYWTQWSFDANSPNAKELVLVHQIPGGSLEPFGALVVRFDRDKLSRMLRTMTPYNDGLTFLLHDSGNVYAYAGSGSDSSGLLAALRDHIATAGSAKGFFFFDWKDTTYTVSYGSMSRIAADWTYVSASPITGITAPVILISKLIIALSCASLLLACLLAWLASRTIYSPVKRLVHVLLEGKAAAGAEDEFTLIERQWHTMHRESRHMNTLLSEQLSHVRESFLHQLLQGYMYAYSEADLLNRMERYKWETADRQFIIVYVRLSGMANEEGKFRYGDEGLVTFAAVNMIGELASEYFEQSSAVNFHDLSAGLLLIVPIDRSCEDDLLALGHRITEDINRILNMRVTIAYGHPKPHLSDLPHVFERARQAAGYRSFESGNQLIDVELHDPDGEAESERHYPFAVERELIQALRTGREDDALELLESFLQALSGGGAKEIDVQQGALQLLGSIQHAMMASGIHPNRLFRGANPYEQLSAIREPKLILAWLRDKVAVPLLRELACRSDAQAKRIIEQAMAFIQVHYHQDISLDNCADHVGTNPFYLSKTFKQVTGTNFIDYLTELRMEKAKELLRESELRINDVAEQVGYQHSYFNRIFKKAEGVTPTRYRELSRSSQ